jgi:hypothetical protein
MAIGSGRQITLDETVKLLFELNGMACFVSEEVVGDLVPDAARRDVVLHDEIKQIVGKSGVDPH